MGVGLLVSLIVGLMAAAFLWPITSMSPQNIEVAVAGPGPSAQMLTQSFAEQDPDLFDIEPAADRDEAVELIKDRSVSGAFVVTRDQVEILTASAGNPQIAQVLTQMAQGIQAATAQGGEPMRVEVTDVVAGPANPAAVNMVMLPALIGGLSGGILVSVLLGGIFQRFIALITIAVAGGATGAAIIGPAFSVLNAGFFSITLALGAGILAISATVAGLASILGRVGIGLGAVLFMLIGNPWGGSFAPNAFLPDPMATIGRALPNAHVIEILRSMSFFPDASNSQHWAIFAIWIGIGLILLFTSKWIPTAKTRRT